MLRPPTFHMQQTWSLTKSHLESVLPPHTFNTWIKPLNYQGTREGHLYIEVPNSFYKERIQSSYAHLILSKIRQLSENHLINISFVLPSSQEPAEAIASFSKNKTLELLEKKDTRARATLNPKHTFDNFIIGAHNQFANAAAMAVCESPGMLYNPLLIYGGVGLGKTHLLGAIGHEILRRNPGKSVVYKTSEEFVNQLIQSIRTQKMDEFRNQFRMGLDVLMIDDIQFFAGKERTQEEFFHTFNALHQSGVQIVMTSDRMPKEIPEIDERLSSRFEWGLSCDIGSPDLETRMAILKKKAEQSMLDLPDDVAEYIAQTSKMNVRTLEGSLISLMAKASLQRRPLNLEFAKEVLASVMVKDPLTIEQIQKHVSGFFNLSIQDMRSAKRQKIVSHPRQIAMYLSRKHTGSSYPEIGQKFGGKDHTTIIHAVEKIERLLLEDTKLRHTVEALEKNLF